jgi:hypothetical protein
VHEAFAHEHYGLKAGQYVQFDIRDNGCGMDSETLAHVFEPFFTTKRKGSGSGLGMTTVYGIVQQCGGYIEVFSRLDHGTTAMILLPQADEKRCSTRPCGRAESRDGNTTDRIEARCECDSSHDCCCGRGSPDLILPEVTPITAEFAKDE